MKKYIIVMGSIIFSALSLSVVAQSEEDNKKWIEYATPSTMQKMMASWDGEWDEDITMWMAPGAPEQKSKASCVNRMILDGRYQESVHKGEFAGMPFNGIGTLAWDNTLKVFVNTWIDNFGTGMMYMTGSWDEKSKVISLSGTMTDPISGKAVPIRQVVRIIDDKTQVMEQYTQNNGKDFLNMSITMKKRK